MNVLLAEAKVPYDIVFEMDELNDDFPTRRRDGHRRQRHRESGGAGRSDEPDRRHAGARSVEGEALDRDEAAACSGYAGVDNPLFYKDNNRMLFGDARKCSTRS
jgi:NAD(P) transhydrogenase subunit beta